MQFFDKDDNHFFSIIDMVFYGKISVLWYVEFSVVVCFCFLLGGQIELFSVILTWILS